MSGFFDFISSLIDYLNGFVESSKNFISLAIKSSDFLARILALVPDYFYAVIIIFISVMVVLHVLNRG